MTKRRVALVTGGTDGIGRATAGMLLAAGWEVVVVGRDCARVRTQKPGGHEQLHAGHREDQDPALGTERADAHAHPRDLRREGGGARTTR